MKLLVVALAGILVLAGACSDDDDTPNGGAGDGDLLFPVEQADELAHAAMPAVEDLPGEGWEVTATDDFGEEEDGAAAFFALAEQEPACEQITDLATLGDIVGAVGDEAGDAAGRAQAEFERTGGALLPSSVTVDIKIQETTGAVQDGWSLARSILASDDTSACLAAVMAATFAEEAGGEFDVTLEPIPAPVAAPQEGAVLAFAMTIEVPEVLTLDAVMAMYMWPYGNAMVQVVMFGDGADLTEETVEGVIGAVDEAVVGAAE